MQVMFVEQMDSIGSEPGGGFLVIKDPLSCLKTIY